MLGWGPGGGTTGHLTQIYGQGGAGAGGEHDFKSFCKAISRRQANASFVERPLLKKLEEAGEKLIAVDTWATLA